MCAATLLLSVFQVKPDVQPQPVPVLVHQKEVSEHAVSEFLWVRKRVIGFNQVGGVHQLSQVQAFGYLNNLVYAVTVWRDGSQFGPPVIQLKDILVPAVFVDGFGLTRDVEEAFQVIS